MDELLIREGTKDDLSSILYIYNQGIEDRIATLEVGQKDLSYMLEWYEKHKGRHRFIVAQYEDEIIGWASLNQYNSRCVYDGVADLSIYILREARGKGVGGKLLSKIENLAKENKFHKIILFTFPFNLVGQSLYKKNGYREVGVFLNQGVLDGKLVDVMAMEKIL
ncbi:arsinothricin resistance N-acetyltransferase ArsN1 family A [Litchfieldia alkalitelluris]|uniref:arsinothricin resistance N-acetyltransferase ArsN1 family A n=1 Tax=Litchfieldia alkalitelluris TaxID=304268 RepID=UPI00099774AE|nr:arsinothricin resistance N-acetyltransferase ArsN1 family A [Litchfieldia alkalitelluris]